MTARDISCRKLAEEIGMSAPGISRYLSGVREPEIESVYRFAQYFDVSLDWLLGIVDNEKETTHPEVQEVSALYQLASPDDKAVIQAVLAKYRRYNETNIMGQEQQD